MRRPPDMAAARLAIDDALSQVGQPIASTQPTKRAESPVLMKVHRLSRGAYRPRVWPRRSQPSCSASRRSVFGGRARAPGSRGAGSGDDSSAPDDAVGRPVFARLLAGRRADRIQLERKHEDNFDVYIKSVGSAAVRRLTSDAGFDGNPSWSPDGTQIAFIRGQAGGASVYVTSSLGGTERKLGDFAIGDSADLARFCPHRVVPDPNYVAAAGAPPTIPARDGEGAGGIYLLPVSRGAPRLLVPAPGAMMHFSPAFSRDGRRVVYVSCKGVSSCDVYVVDLDSILAAKGPPRRLTRHTNPCIGEVAWSPDDRSIIYDAEVVPMSNHLWRVAVDGASPPERLEAAGFARLPATARSGDRVAFTEWRWTSTSIGSTQAGRRNRYSHRRSWTWTRSTRPMATHRVQLRADCRDSGDRIAASDGRGAHQLTQGPETWQVYPAWSPDGQQIVFESFDDGAIISG